LYRANYLLPDTLGGPVVYLLPIVTLWFSLETKLLTHLKVGTPFHPSWWMYGSKVVGQVPRYAASDWVNVTFSLATALITIILTSYAWVATNVAVGFSAVSFFSVNTWKFAVSHGMLFIFHSGLWMIVASSGVPHLGKAKKFQIFPPQIPAFFQCDPKKCIDIHKIDLVIGHFLLTVGAFWLGDGSNKDSPQNLVTKLTVGVAWIFSLVYKGYIHSQHCFEAPYWKEKALEKTNEKKSEAKSN